MVVLTRFAFAKGVSEIIHTKLEVDGAREKKVDIMGVQGI
jgi:hypothetical protein